MLYHKEHCVTRYFLSCSSSNSLLHISDKPEFLFSFYPLNIRRVFFRSGREWSRLYLRTLWISWTGDNTCGRVRSAGCVLCFCWHCSNLNLLLCSFTLFYTFPSAVFGPMIIWCCLGGLLEAFWEILRTRWGRRSCRFSGWEIHWLRK